MVSCENYDLESEFLLAGSASSISGNKGSQTTDFDDPDSQEKFLLEGIDSYWDDLNTSLIVSRMVNDAVIKGMVNAVRQEAADNIIIKDIQVADLNDRLRRYELEGTASNRCCTSSMLEKTKRSKTETQLCFTDMQWNHKEHLNCLKKLAEDQLQKLKNRIEFIRSSGSIETVGLATENVNLYIQEKVADSIPGMEQNVEELMNTVGSIYKEIDGVFYLFNNSISEQQWRWDFQKDVANFIVQHYIKGLLEEFGSKFSRERNIYIRQNTCSKKFNKLRSLRNELDDVINKFNRQPGYLKSQGSHEKSEQIDIDRNTCKVLGNHLSSYSSPAHENGSSTVKKFEAFENGSSTERNLKHLSRDDLITHFRTEMSKMRRNHELALHQKTEELFKLKREFLKDKGLISLRKDREFEVLKKKLKGFFVKFDDILQQNESFSAKEDDYYCDPQDHYKKLVCENQHLRDLLSEKEREIKYLTTQVSHAAIQISNHSSKQDLFFKQMQNLQVKNEDLKFEAELRDGIFSILLQEAIIEMESCMNFSGIEAEFYHESYSLILQGFMHDIRSSTDALIRKHEEERKLLESSVMQKDECLYLEIENSKKLRHDIESLSQVVREKEMSEKEAASSYLQQKQEFEVVQRELLMLKDKTSEQEKMILKNRKECDLLNSRLQEADDKSQLYMKELIKKENLFNEAFLESDTQKKVLRENIEKTQNKLDILTSEKSQQKKVMKSIVLSVLNLSKTFDDFGSEIAEKINRINSRLDNVNCQQDSILQEVVGIHKVVSRCKHTIETKSSNLQKAEKEVDLLGDEVDSLLSVLTKVYIALNHYSPVLQHYPGVMEIMKLVRKEVEGNAKPLPF